MNLFSVNRKRLYLSLLFPLVLSDFIGKRIFVIIASLTGVYTPGGLKTAWGNFIKNGTGNLERQ